MPWLARSGVVVKEHMATAVKLEDETWLKIGKIILSTLGNNATCILFVFSCFTDCVNKKWHSKI